MKQAIFETKPFSDLLEESPRNGIYKSKDYWGSGVKMIRMGELFKYDFIDARLPEFELIELTDKEKENLLLRDYDLLFSRTSVDPEGVGKCSLVKTFGSEITFDSNAVRLRLNRCLAHPQFYLYYFASPEARHQVKSISGGAAVSSVKGSSIIKLEVPYPSIKIQHSIVHVLSAYDDLIENNTRRIAILEEMAQALYREWFVRGQVPGTSEVPGTFDPRNGRVPEGWRLVELGEIAKEVRRSVQPTEIDPATPYIGLAHMPKQSIALSEWGTADEANSTKLVFKKGEILFGKIRPYFHKVGVAPIDGVCSTDAIVIIPKSPEWFSIVLGCVSSTDFVEHATQTSKGTKMPRADWNVLVKYQVAIPPESLLSRFNAVIEPIVMQIQNLIFRNANLRQTRDLLLPRLVSGELDVSELEITL